MKRLLFATAVVSPMFCSQARAVFEEAGRWKNTFGALGTASGITQEH